MHFPERSVYEVSWRKNVATQTWQLVSRLSVQLRQLELQAIHKLPLSYLPFVVAQDYEQFPRVSDGVATFK